MTANLKPYPNMKDSGVEALGKVPAHWDVLRLKRICRLVYGDSLSEENRRKGNVPVFGSNGYVGSHYAANTNAPCIIVGRKGSFGKVNYSLTPVFAIDTTFFVDPCWSSGHIRWLYFLLGWLRLDDVTRDSAVPGLDREEAYRRVVPIPRFSEQEAIVRFLDHADHRIQRYIRARQRLIALLAEQKQAIIHQAVTGQIEVRTGRPYSAYRPSGVEWLRTIPKHWSVRRLKSICSRSALYGANVPASSYADAGVRFLRTTDITEDGQLRDEGVFVPADLVEDYILSDGDLLISRSGTIGRSFIYNSKKHGPCAYAGYLVRFIADKSVVLPKYLFWFTKTRSFGNFLRVNAISSTIENLNGEKYGNCSLPVPPLSEQTTIVRFLDHTERLIRHQIAATRKLIALLDEFRTRLIADVIAGRIDVRDVSTSPPAFDPVEQAE